jgi:exopolyphosphatase/guanosine-5'-triphosphate,3'-diphosphate pyrophosphatase
MMAEGQPTERAARQSAGHSASAKPVRRAVIDVGTNSVKLLVADVSNHAVHPLFERSEQTRLGSGFYQTHRLRPVAIERTARAVARFAAEAAEFEPKRIRVIATSAARDALNQHELFAAIKRVSDLRAEVISGEQEADWAFRGVISDPAFAGQPLLIVDVGGGSSEFILGEGARQQFRHSFPLGTVRLLQQIELSDPPTAEQWRQCREKLEALLQEQILPVLGSELRTFRAGAVQCVGTSGTSSIMARIELGLARFERDRIEGARLSREQVGRQRKHLWRLPLVDRKQIVGLPANRADVILAGVAIYEAILDRFSFDELRVSTRGLRFAAVLEP